MCLQPGWHRQLSSVGRVCAVRRDIQAAAFGNFHLLQTTVVLMRVKERWPPMHALFASCLKTNICSLSLSHSHSSSPSPSTPTPQCSSSYFPFPLSNASIALLGVVVLLISGALTWTDLVTHRPAWDLLVWLSILFSMCTALADLGVIKWLR